MDSFLDTFVGDIPKPASQFNPEIPQEGIDLPQYQAPQTEQRSTTPVFYLVERADSISPDPRTVEVTEDFILTHISVQCTGDPIADFTSEVRAYIGEEQFLAQRIVCASNTEHFISTQEIPIPNWLIPKGTLFGAYIDAVADGSARANITFIGYKKN